MRDERQETKGMWTAVPQAQVPSKTRRREKRKAGGSGGFVHSCCAPVVERKAMGERREAVKNEERKMGGCSDKGPRWILLACKVSAIFLLPSWAQMNASCPKASSIWSSYCFLFFFLYPIYIPLRLATRHSLSCG